MCKTKKEGGLGFRNLQVFNQSLLAKQGWKIISQPSSLLSKFFKSFYFPYSFFMQCDNSTRSSFVWRGLLRGKQLLEQGLGWRVGNGESIPILNLNCLPGTSSFKLFSPPSDPSPPFLMADLIIKKGEVWNWDTSKIHIMISPIHVDRILLLPVSPAHLPANIDGTFSVKGCYWFAS